MSSQALVRIDCVVTVAIFLLVLLSVSSYSLIILGSVDLNTLLLDVYYKHELKQT